MWSLLRYFWYGKQNTIPLEDEWYPIPSDKEEKLANEAKSRVERELQTIQRFDTTTISVEAPNISLTADMKNRVYKDVLTKLSPPWLQTLTLLSPGIEKDWYPSTYEKNLLGQLIDIADRFSPSTLSEKAVSQTIKTIHRTLVNFISTHRGVSLDYNEKLSIMNLLTGSVVSPLIELWVKAGKAAEKSTTNHGRLQLKWKEEEKRKEMEILSRPLSGRWSEGDLDPVRKAYVEKDKISLMSKGDFNKTKDLLTRSMQVKKQKIHCKPERFNETKTLLESRLVFRK